MEKEKSGPADAKSTAKNGSTIAAYSEEAARRAAVRERRRSSVAGKSLVATNADKPTVLDVHGYRVGRTLGHGSYGTVKEAWSQKHKTRVAIKILSKRRAPQV